MQIAVLSDFHMGCRDRLDRFARAKSADAFWQLLTHLTNSVDRIILLGDIFETLRGPIPGTFPIGAKQQLRRTMKAYPDLSERILHHEKFQLVHGNHDQIAHAILGAPEMVELVDHQTKLLFFHGHQLDHLARDPAPISRLGVWSAGMAERLFHLPVTNIKDARNKRRRHDGRIGTAQRGAVRLAKERGADIVINGHSHQPQREEIDGLLYLNSGSCVAGRLEYLLLDTATKSYEAIDRCR